MSFAKEDYELSNTDLRLVVNRFVALYCQNKVKALQWADEFVDKRLYPKLKPEIRVALKKRGFREADKDV